MVKDTSTLKTSIVDKINELKLFGVTQEDIYKLTDKCKSLNSRLHNQFFSNMICDLETRRIYCLYDIYVLEDLDKIKKFVKSNS
jgi:hypothetical protein